MRLHLKKTVMAVCSGAALLLMAGTALAQAFLPALEDVPLMPGLEAVAPVTAFDTPAGRVVVVHAQGGVTPAAVSAFYDQTLPQLGWRLSPAQSFLREGERLELTFLGDGDPLVVRYILSPQ